MRLLTLLAISGLLVAGCSGVSERTASGLDRSNFEDSSREDSTALYVLKNETGMEVCITNYGGRVVSVLVPDKEGKMQDVVLGFDNVKAYFPENNPSDFGAAIGRYANRINGGRFVLNGDTIRLPQNNFGHCLHGGTDMGTLGWQYRVYKAKQIDDSTLELTLRDADGNNGFPGTVDAKVIYRVLADNTLDISYEATTDKPTVINMTNHSYFNLSGKPERGVEDHTLYVNAESFTPVDSTFMTTGLILPVAGTPMDFRTAKRIGEDIGREGYEQTEYANGYDHNWVLATKGRDNVVAATLYSPESGISMDVLTDEPGIQIYTGNFLDGTITGKNGKTYNKRAAICLETQHYPDSPNKPQWPAVTLNPGEKYKSHCAYRFSVK